MSYFFVDFLNTVSLRELLVTFSISFRDETGYGNFLTKDLIICEFYD